MKIAFVLDDTLDSSDGVQQYVLTLGAWLRQQAHEVHYLVGQTSRTDIPHVHSLSRNVSVRFNGNRMTIPLPVARRRIQALLAQEQFDVIHVQMPHSPFLGARIVEHAPRDTAIMGTFHIMPLGRLQQFGSHMLIRWLRPSMQRMNQVVSVSQPAAAFASRLGVVSDILPNAVDTRQFRRGRKLDMYTKTFTIVFLGRLVARKGCLQLLRALKLLAEQHKLQGVQVLICGRGPSEARLKSLAAAWGIQDHIKFVGYVSEEAKAHYLASADIAVFPSVGGESFGIVLLESMAAGAGVVIAGNNPGYANVLKSMPQVLFDPRNTARLALLLDTLRQDPEQRKQLHEKQQALVARYDVARVGAKLVSYYQAIKHKKQGGTQVS